MKFAIAVNAKLDPGAQFNAFGHAALGLARRVGASEFSARVFETAKGEFLAEMTDRPLIALSARNANQLRQAHLNALQSGIECNAFVADMYEGSAQDQQRCIANSQLQDLPYCALALFGDDQNLRPITRKFSLLRR